MDGLTRTQNDLSQFIIKSVLLYLRMGSSSSSQIKVATANYSGITYSPFEFYETGKDKQAEEDINRINEIFKDLFNEMSDEMAKVIPDFRQYFPGNEAVLVSKKDLKQEGNNKEMFFNWKISNIEKSIQRGRYCPQYRQDAGFENGRLLTKQQFYDKWQSEYEKNVKYVKFDEPDKKKELDKDQQKEICKRFDYLVFKTLVEFSYQKIWPKLQISNRKKFVLQLQDKYPNDNSKEARTARKQALHFYQAILAKYHNKAFLKHNQKYKHIKDLILTHDVVFLQDCSDQLINEIKNQGDFTIIQQLKGRDSYIVIKTNLQKFTKLYDAKKYINTIQEDTKSPFRRAAFEYKQSFPAVCLTDRFLFMSIHFSSKTSKKYEQLIKFMEHLTAIHTEYNAHNKLRLQIVVGGDFNSNIKHFFDEPDYRENYKQNENNLQYNKVRSGHIRIATQFWQIFKLYPTNLTLENSIITTRKRRTWLQSQAGKADVTDQSSRDFLISNCDLLKCDVIRNGSSSNDFLPTEQHPFDHFFISAVVQKLEKRN